jgi:hypothetical protein
MHNSSVGNSEAQYGAAMDKGTLRHQFIRVHHRSEGCGVSQKGCSVAQQNAVQLTTVHQSSVKCSIAPQGAALLCRVQLSLVRHSVVQRVQGSSDSTAKQSGMQHCSVEIKSQNLLIFARL